MLARGVRSSRLPSSTHNVLDSYMTVTKPTHISNTQTTKFERYTPRNSTISTAIISTSHKRKSPGDPNIEQHNSAERTKPAKRQRVAQSTHVFSYIPNTLEKLIQLFRSLLRALSLHFAHHGTISPAPLHVILPSASKIWGKRSIKVEDVERCWSLLSAATTTDTRGLELWNYGKAGICFELKSPQVKHRNSHGASTNGTGVSSPFDEENLLSNFETTVLHAWGAFQMNSSKREELVDPNDESGDQGDIEGEEEEDRTMLETQATQFLTSIQMQHIASHPSLIKSQTSHKKNLGQARLDAILKTPSSRKRKAAEMEEQSKDTKDRSEAKATTETEIGLPTPAATPSSTCSSRSSSSDYTETDSTTTPTTTPSSTPHSRSEKKSVTPKDRKNALLARLAEKSSPASPKGSSPSSQKGTNSTNTSKTTEEEIRLNQSALQILPSIVQILSLLSSRSSTTDASTSTRKSFSLPTLLQYIRESSLQHNIAGGRILEDAVIVRTIGLLSGNELVRSASSQGARTWRCVSPPLSTSSTKHALENGEVMDKEPIAGRDFVKIVKIGENGGILGVVVDGSRLCLEGLEERVQAWVAAC